MRASVPRRLSDFVAARRALAGRHAHEDNRARPPGLRRDRRQAMQERTVRLVAGPIIGMVVLACIAVWQPELLSAMAGGWELAALGVFTIGLVAVGGLLVVRLEGPEWLAHAATVVPVAVVFVVAAVPALGPPESDGVRSGVEDAGNQRPAAAVRPGPPAEPVELAGGPLRGIGHRASGQVLLVQAPNRIEIRLEHVRVDPLPDLQVYVARGTGTVAGMDGATRLGDLRPDGGRQRLPVPAGSVRTAPATVLIWCPGAAAPIAMAVLQRTGGARDAG
jgi:hypothetical protein